MQSSLSDIIDIYFGKRIGGSEVVTNSGVTVAMLLLYNNNNNNNNNPLPPKKKVVRNLLLIYVRLSYLGRHLSIAFPRWSCGW